MKHAKKMRLVECLEESPGQQKRVSGTTQNVKDEDYSKPQALQNLDFEMEAILNDTSTDTDQKWLLYNQVLQRYLGIIRRIRQGDRIYTGNSSIQSIRYPSTDNSFITVRSDLENNILPQAITSTPVSESLRTGLKSKSGYSPITKRKQRPTKHSFLKKLQRKTPPQGPFYYLADESTSSDPPTLSKPAVLHRRRFFDANRGAKNACNPYCDDNDIEIDTETHNIHTAQYDDDDSDGDDDDDFDNNNVRNGTLTKTPNAGVTGWSESDIKKK